MENYRAKIDELDREIMKLVEKRFEICNEIGIYKMNNNIETEDKKRESDIFEKISDYQYSENITRIFEKILQESKKIQEDLK